MMSAPDTVAPAAERLHNLLRYVEQVVRLDERPALRLSEHGPVWLAVERLRRSDPPAPPELAADWLEIWRTVNPLAMPSYYPRD